MSSKNDKNVLLEPHVQDKHTSTWLQKQTVDYKNIPVPGNLSTEEGLVDHFYTSEKIQLNISITGPSTEADTKILLK